MDKEKDRVERMGEWLQENREKILESNKGKITFDYKGTIVTARLEEVYERI